MKSNKRATMIKDAGRILLDGFWKLKGCARGREEIGTCWKAVWMSLPSKMHGESNPFLFVLLLFHLLGGC